MKRKFITDEKDYGELDTGKTVLSFASHKLGKSNFQGGYISTAELKAPESKPRGKWFLMCVVLQVFFLSYVPPLLVNST